MRPDEKLHSVHEYGCGRGLFYDLECSCWDGPRVTEQDLKERAQGGPAAPRFTPEEKDGPSAVVLPLYLPGERRKR